jgi:hypothetical protein
MCQPALWMYLSLVAVIPDDVLPVAVTAAVQRLRDMRICPDPAHLFIDVLAKVGYVEDTTPFVESR